MVCSAVFCLVRSVHKQASVPNQSIVSLALSTIITDVAGLVAARISIHSRFHLVSHSASRMESVTDGGCFSIGGIRSRDRTSITVGQPYWRSSGAISSCRSSNLGSSLPIVRKISGEWPWLVTHATSTSRPHSVCFETSWLRFSRSR